MNIHLPKPVSTIINSKHLKRGLLIAVLALAFLGLLTVAVYKQTKDSEAQSHRNAVQAAQVAKEQEAVKAENASLKASNNKLQLSNALLTTDRAQLCQFVKPQVAAKAVKSSAHCL